MFTLRFPLTDVARWAELYAYDRPETDLLAQRDLVQRSGRLSKPLLHQVARWKSPRRAGNVLDNADSFVEEISAFAFAAQDERARIESLTLLDGVSWPTASVVLHLFHRDPYPILDFRALWSLSADVPQQYGFPFWWAYVEECRSLRKKCSSDMRTLDRALWQYSKLHQPSKGAAGDETVERPDSQSG